MMGTQAGMILGTAAYMSPEQAKGFPADQRSDVFAFGVVLYEMLTGRQPFSGDTAPDVLASVIVRDADLDALPPNLNPRLRELIERCLEKSPKKRWQAIGDVRAEIEKIATAPHSTAVSAATPQPLWRRAVPIVMTAILFAVVGASAIWHYRPKPAPPRPIRFVVPLPQGQQLANAVRRVLDISPDGSHLLFVANQTLLYGSSRSLRLDQFPESTPAKAASSTRSSRRTVNPSRSTLEQTWRLSVSRSAAACLSPFPRSMRPFTV